MYVMSEPKCPGVKWPKLCHAVLDLAHSYIAADSGICGNEELMPEITQA